MSGDLFSIIPPPVLGILLLILIGLVLVLLEKTLDKFWKAFFHSLEVLFGGKPKKAPERMAGTGGGGPYWVLILVIIVILISIIISAFYGLPLGYLYGIGIVAIIAAAVFSFIMKQIGKINSTKQNTVLDKNYQSSSLPSIEKPLIKNTVPMSELKTAGTRKRIEWIGVSNKKIITEAFEIPDNSNARWYIDRYWLTYWRPYEIKLWKSEWLDTAHCLVEIRDEETHKLLKVIQMGCKKPVEGFEVDEEDNYSEELTIWGRLYLVIDVSGFMGNWRTCVHFFEPVKNPPDLSEEVRFDAVTKRGFFRD
jgi:hypothetical protein